MNCWRIQNLVAPFLEGELPDAETSAVADHLEECPACDALVQSVAGLPDLVPPDLTEACAGVLDAFDEALAERIALSAIPSLDVDAGEESAAWGVSQPAALPPRRAPAMRTWALTAAAGLLVLLAGWSMHTQQRIDDLEQSLAERDDLIRRLERQVIAANGSFDEALPQAVGAESVPVFLPAAAPSPQTLSAGALPAYGLASIDRPRIVR